ncbi:ABC transporter permease [Aureimonas phyllosphaerae]|uniref:Osmoprotectant transport system permease protein n=1 Tax=Aureimonas phyllosphaerae TaxID=1166078 RepID=A0A7W6FV55_9HYPH|nr:ABC transporter permease [Aureimonas phyllosphaerae]MBB3935687.1 osmoprotectant transport system permease protein [Aureimonas phyllosphaerae]MBB3959695.1 osmoprotectant transport system permease protein [Aureimonas phyllosphaerae]SFF13885.1 osmoprotectant transport system permease protein [Aureimonas phyllosphaerae]
MSLAAPIARTLALALLAAVVLTPQAFAPLLQPLVTNGAPAIYTQTSLLALTVSHLELVLASILAAFVVATGLAILVTRRFGADFLPLSRSIVNVGQTFPPVAVLALAVPAVGFGLAPTLFALFLYGLLPIFENAVAGLNAAGPPVMEAARGVGLTPWQRLWRVELPLALPLIVSGLRLSVVVGLGTATIGSTVGAPTLGEVIIAGLLSGNTAFVVQGAVIVGLLAVLVFDALSLLERRLALPRRG